MDLRLMITKEGFILLNKELKRLNSQLKNQENMAETELAIFKKRINHLEDILPTLMVVNKINKPTTVSFGNTVVLRNFETNEEIKYQIVGTEEVNMKLNKISNLSPFAKELLGKSINEEVIDLQDNEYEIINIL